MTEQFERKVKDKVLLWEKLHIADVEPSGGIKNEIYCKGCAFRKEETNGCYKETDDRWWYFFEEQRFFKMKRNEKPGRACCVEKYLWGKND